MLAKQLEGVGNQYKDTIILGNELRIRGDAIILWYCIGLGAGEVLQVGTCKYASIILG